MKYKAICFDVDGMLNHSTEYFSLRLARENNIPDEDILPFFKTFYKDCQCGNKDLKEELPKMLSKWNWDGSVDELLAYWFESEKDLNVELLQIVADLKSKDVKCYVTTNQEKNRLNFLKENMDFDALFDMVFASCEIGVGKPERPYFETIWEQMQKDTPGITKSDVIFWDDQEKNIVAAKEFGFDVEIFVNQDAFLQKIK